jgi:hypothetical protein
VETQRQFPGLRISEDSEIRFLSLPAKWPPHITDSLTHF